MDGDHGRTHLLVGDRLDGPHELSGGQNAPPRTHEDLPIVHHDHDDPGARVARIATLSPGSRLDPGARGQLEMRAARLGDECEIRHVVEVARDELERMRERHGEPLSQEMSLFFWLVP